MAIVSTIDQELGYRGLGDGRRRNRLGELGLLERSIPAFVASKANRDSVLDIFKAIRECVRHSAVANAQQK